MNNTKLTFEDAVHEAMYRRQLQLEQSKSKTNFANIDQKKQSIIDYHQHSFDLIFESLRKALEQTKYNY